MNRLKTRNQNRQAKVSSWHTMGTMVSSPAFGRGEDYGPPGYASYQETFQPYSPAADVDYHVGSHATPVYPEAPYPQSYGGPVDSYYPQVPPQHAASGYGMCTYGSIHQGSYGREYEAPPSFYGTANVSDSMYHQQMYSSSIPVQSTYTAYSQPHYQQYQYPPQSHIAPSFYGGGGPLDPQIAGGANQRKMNPQELVARLKANGHMS